MKTVIRNSYTPKTGDYCETIVVDKETENAYVFDCDGIFTPMPQPVDVEDILRRAAEYTDETVAPLEEKLDTVEEGAQVNVIETITQNGQPLTVTNKTVNVTVPTKTSDLENDGSDGTDTYVESSTLDDYYTKAETDTQIGYETDAREIADQGLQEQIDAIVASSDVVDIVGTYAALQAYDTSGLSDNDIIKVLADETRDDAITYYRWDADTSTWTYIGAEGPFYTKAESDALFTPMTRTVNGKALSTDITLTAADVHALPDSTVIPTVNDATLTIQKNGTTVQTFTANQASNATANIVVPTDTSDLTNDGDGQSPFATEDYVDTYGGKIDTIEVNGAAQPIVNKTVDITVPTKTSDLTNDGSDGGSTYVEADDLATVATSGDYDDLLNKPTIPTVNDATLTIQKNGVDVAAFTANSASAVTANITVPTDTADLTNGAGFITSSALSDYYTKSETYSQQEVNSLINTLPIPTKTSDLTNDGSDGTSTYVEADDLAAVATSGSYNDLSNKPTIPTIVDMTGATASTAGAHGYVPAPAAGDQNKFLQGDGTWATPADEIYTAGNGINIDANNEISVDTSVVATQTDLSGKQDTLTAGSNMDITSNVISAKVDSALSVSSTNPVQNSVVTAALNNKADTSDLPSKTSDLTNDGSDGTSTYVEADELATVATSGSYNDLTNKPTIPAAQVNSDWDAISGVAQILNKPTLAAVATSGSYNDLSNKPTIGNATLTIQKNGTSAGTFTANATSNKTINITVPTTAADVSALPDSTKYGASIAVSINTTDYKVTTTLKDQDGNTLGTAQVIDLPLESVVVNGSYDSTNKKIVLTLQNGNTIDIPVADLVAGLQTEITSSNKLASDLVDDTNQTHKFMTSAEKTKLAGIATGAEVNQNAFSNVKVGSTTVAADTKTDTLELVAGSNVTLTPDATNDKVTIAATDTTYSDATTSASGLMSAADKTKLNGIATGAEVNVQANWTQTTTTADDYIKNKPNLAAVATSGSYTDLSDKPTIPTVNNGTLTIQKNGTNVQTFTANQSTNTTANITVPTDTSDLTNGAGYITSSGSITGNAATATKLAAGKTIALGTGATGTATSFDGSSNITIPVTDVKDAYVTWGGKPLYSTVSPDDAGCIDEFGHNKMAFLPANCIQVHYSTNGGSTWTDYGLTDAQKIQLVTYGDVFCKTGGTTAATSSNITNLKLRIRIATAASTTTTGIGSLYTDWRKVLLNVNDPNSNCNMTMRYRTIANYKSGTETWVDSGITYPVRGGTAWNSIPRPSGWPVFGGNYANQTSQIGQLEFVLSNTALGTWGDKKGSICSIRMIGTTNWQMPSEMARAGHLYTVDSVQNATFPKEIALTDLHALNVLPKSGDTTYRHLGRSGEEWKDVWLTDAIYANGNKLSLPATAGTLALTSDMPTVNNATLTIQKNGTDVQTFTANSSTNKTANITVPTKTSDLNNDSNFVASGDLATVATSGSYNDLSNKPTIPTVNNGTLTIQKNGTTVNTFTANSSNNVTANIPVPTLSTTDTDPGEGSALAADTFLGVYDIAPTAIDGSRITNGTVTTNKLANNAITAAKVDFSTFGVAATVNGPSSTTSKSNGAAWASTDMYTGSVSLAAGTYLVVVTGSAVAFSAGGEQEWFNITIDSTIVMTGSLAWFTGATIGGNGVGIATIGTSGTHTVAYQLGAQGSRTCTLYSGSKISFVRIG